MDDAHISSHLSFAVVQSLLHEQLGDPHATLLDYEVEPIASHGVSGNAIYRVRLQWENQKKGETVWIIKRWRRGGHSEAELALTHSVEAAAYVTAEMRRWLL